MKIITGDPGLNVGEGRGARLMVEHVSIEKRQVELHMHGLLEKLPR
jgi:hypothetical protein